MTARQYQCPLCGKQFIGEDNLARHLVRVPTFCWPWISGKLIKDPESSASSHPDMGPSIARRDTTVYLPGWFDPRHPEDWPEVQKRREQALLGRNDYDLSG